MTTEKEPLSYKVSIVLEFFEEELHQWRKIARMNETKKEKELIFRERFERNCAKQLFEEVQKHEQDVEDFQCKEQEYREEIEEMAKRHSTELDANASLNINLRDCIRFLEGKPMSTRAEAQSAMGKETGNVMTRVSEPLELSPTQFTPTPDSMPVRAKPLFSRRPANANEQAEQEKAEAMAQEEAENRRLAEFVTTAEQKGCADVKNLGKG